MGELPEERLPQGAVETSDTGRLLDLTRQFMETPPAPHPNRDFTRRKMLDETMDLYQQLV